MLRKLLQRDTTFFELFSEMGDRIVEASQEFVRLLEAKPEDRDGFGQKIKQLEHDADAITHKTMTMLHKTFITPIDREDIHSLIKRLDDVMDFLDAAAQRIVLYRIGETPATMLELANINVQAIELVRKVVTALSDLKNSEGLLAASVEINRLENDADRVLRTVTAELFADEPDVRTLIKLKEIYELLETVSDRCEDVANVIESIVLEYS